MKLGKLPARQGAIKFKLRNYVPDYKVPAKAGHQQLIKSWGMLGNDEYGDCVCAGAGHETMLWNAERKNAVVIETPEALLMYHDVTGFDINNPATDQGTDMEEAAKWRRKTGILDTNSKRHKVAAYLDISPIEGGHYVPAVGYDEKYVYVITWGEIQKMAWSFFEKYCDEAIAYLSKDMLDGNKSLEGFNYTQLQKDLASL